MSFLRSIAYKKATLGYFYISRSIVLITAHKDADDSAFQSFSKLKASGNPEPAGTLSYIFYYRGEIVQIVTALRIHIYLDVSCDISVNVSVLLQFPSWQTPFHLIYFVQIPKKVSRPAPVGFVLEFQKLL